MQDKSKLGTRYECFQCALKFYDLNRPEPLCPKCGADQRENPNPDPREAILSRFKGKGIISKPRAEETFEDEEEAEESDDSEESDEIDEEEDESAEGAEVEDED